MIIFPRFSLEQYVSLHKVYQNIWFCNTVVDFFLNGMQKSPHFYCTVNFRLHLGSVVPLFYWGYFYFYQCKWIFITHILPCKWCSILSIHLSKYIYHQFLLWNKRSQSLSTKYFDAVPFVSLLAKSTSITSPILVNISYETLIFIHLLSL